MPARRHHLIRLILLLALLGLALGSLVFLPPTASLLQVGVLGALSLAAAWLAIEEGMALESCPEPPEKAPAVAHPK